MLKGKVVPFLLNLTRDWNQKRQPQIEQKFKDKKTGYRCRCCSKIMTEPVLFVGEYWDKPHLVLYMRENNYMINGEK